MRYELAIFDMDGTVLNTLEDLKDSINYALAKNGFDPLTLDQVRNYVGNGSRRLVELAVPDGTGTDMMDKVLADYAPYYQEHSAEKTCPYPGIPELLKTLRAAGVKTAIVSNKPDAAVKKLAQHYFPNLFDMAVGEDEAAGIRRKPSPDEVNFVLNAMDFADMQAVYIGDSDVDIETARNSGLDLIAVDWGFRGRDFLKEKGVQTVVSSAYEIEKLILTDLSSVKKVICPSCGAEFDDNRDRCPYCNSIYEEGAERVYMHKLGEIREDMDELSGKAVTDTVSEVKKVSKQTAKIIIIIVSAVLLLALICAVPDLIFNISDRIESRHIDKWEAENQAKWNELYAEGDYETLYELYTAGDADGDPVWDFDGGAMMDAMDVTRSFLQYYDDYEDPEYRNSKNLLNLMLCDYWDIAEGDVLDDLSEAEKEYLKPETDDVIAKGDALFGLTEEEMKSLTLDSYDNIVSWDKIKDMVNENWDEWKE